jgi:hypothetical protein
MKKLLIILAVIMMPLVVNAQPGTSEKVTFTLPGSLLSNPQRVTLPAEELPKAITDNITATYPGFTIKQAIWDWSTTLVPGNIFIYDVVVSNGSVDEALLYDKDGKFIKKGVVNLMPVKTRGEKPAQAPPKK